SVDSWNSSNAIWRLAYEKQGDSGHSRMGGLSRATPVRSRVSEPPTAYGGGNQKADGAWPGERDELPTACGRVSETHCRRRVVGPVRRSSARSFRWCARSR